MDNKKIMSKPDFAITFLAFGEEHINEFNTTTKQLLDFDNNLHIYVVTDNKELIENKDIHIREIDEPFNYNLKRKSFDFAFEQHNVVMYMDTDILIKKDINDILFSAYNQKNIFIQHNGEYTISKNIHSVGASVLNDFEKMKYYLHL